MSKWGAWLLVVGLRRGGGSAVDGARLGIRGYAARIVVGHARDQSRPDPRQGMLFQTGQKDLDDVIALDSMVVAFVGMHAPHVRLPRDDRILNDNEINSMAPLMMNSNHIGWE